MPDGVELDPAPPHALRGAVRAAASTRLAQEIRPSPRGGCSITVCSGGWRLGRLAFYARLSRCLLAVHGSGWLDVVRLGVRNVVIWHMAVIVALTLLPAGRSAILGYTMPLWAAIIGALWFGEHPPPRHWLG